MMMTGLANPSNTFPDGTTPVNAAQHSARAATTS